MKRPEPAFPTISPLSYTTSPRRIVVFGNPVTSMPACDEYLAGDLRPDRARKIDPMVPSFAMEMELPQVWYRPAVDFRRRSAGSHAGFESTGFEAPFCLALNE